MDGLPRNKRTLKDFKISGGVWVFKIPKSKDFEIHSILRFYIDYLPNIHLGGVWLERSYMSSGNVIPRM